MTKQPLFSSDRERRLWTWTLVMVVAIYSTLGLARTLAGVLRDHELLGATFFVGMILIGLAVLALGLWTRPRGPQIGVALGVAAVYLMVFSRMGLLEERSHLMEYSVVAAFIHEALLERRSQGRAVPVPGLQAILATSFLGVVDECIQLLIPSRVFDVVDMLFNALAALMAVGAGTALRWARRRWPRRKRTDVDPSG
jgi:hypothetical protein